MRCIGGSPSAKTSVHFHRGSREPGLSPEGGIFVLENRASQDPLARPLFVKSTLSSGRNGQTGQRPPSKNLIYKTHGTKS
jgi:hypothetical protein